MSELTKKRVHWKEYNGEELVHDEDVDILTSADSVTFSDDETLQYKFTQGQFVNPSTTGILSNLSTTNKSSLVDAVNEVKTAATSNQSSISSLTTRITTAESDIDNLETRMSTAESDINSLETRVTPISLGGTGATTSSKALTNLGITATASELNYVDGVTSNIQTQLNGKANYEIKKGIDFNSMMTPGLYTMQNSSTNAPTSSKYYSLIVNKSDNGNYVQQIAIKESTTDMYLRYYNSSWSAWVKVGLIANYSATISTNWTGSSAPYTQTVTITGINSSDTPIVDVVLDSDTSTALNQLEAWGCVSKITTGMNQITVTCLEDKPITAIPIQLKVVR